MPRIVTTIEDLRTMARRRVPRMFYDYVDSGSWTGSTYRANEEDFAAIKLRQRIAVDMSNRSLASTMLGQPVAMPLALAPCGLVGMQRADGEILTARAAAKAGVPFTLSTMSICSIEDVAENSDRPFWMQLYFLRDRAFNDRLIERARAAGCSALVLTLDLQILGQRHKDIRNGLSAPPRLTAATLADLATKPRWCFEMLGTKRRTFRNVVGHAEGVRDTRSIGSWTSEQFDPRLSWDDVRRIQDRWKGPLILKGILDVEDAAAAAQIGAEAIIVSNHGGRQLDGAISSVAALPGIVAEIGHRTEVFLDGGVRSGQDVLKAVALGAKGVFIGRPYMYGLGALGERGVSLCLDIIRKELDLTMALCGRRDIREVDGTILVRPPVAAPPDIPEWRRKAAAPTRQAG